MTKQATDNMERVWCPMCEDWIEQKEFIYRSGDDGKHWLCPGCNWDIAPYIENEKKGVSE